MVRLRKPIAAAVVMIGGLLAGLGPAQAAPDTSEPALSEATQACLDCHESLHPGLVADWRASRHARVSPDVAASISAWRDAKLADVPKLSALLS